MALVATTGHVQTTTKASTNDLTVLGVEGTGPGKKNMSNPSATTGEKRKKRSNRKRKPSASASTPPKSLPGDESVSSPSNTAPSSSRLPIGRSATDMSPATRRRPAQGRKEQRMEENITRKGNMTNTNREEEGDYIIATPISTNQGCASPSAYEPRTIFNQTFYPHSPDGVPEPLAHGLISWSQNMKSAGPNVRQEFRQWNMRTLQYWKDFVDKDRFMGDGNGWVAPGIGGAVALGASSGETKAAPVGRRSSAAERVRQRRQRSYTSPGFLLVGGKVVGKGDGETPTSTSTVERRN